MKFTLNKFFWLFWFLASLIGLAILAGFMFVGGPRYFLLIGQTTAAHHQIELACESCHTEGLTAGLFAKKSKLDKSMTKACLTCHEAELKVSNDSHPTKKFRDPRNVETREKLDALFCQSCHAEHTPEITEPMAVTLQEDYCLACHQDIGEERETHVGLGFETCASAGCHNYHDNTALYQQFLVKHADAPAFAEHAVLPFSAISRGPKPINVALTSDDPVASLENYLKELPRPPKDTAKEAQEAVANVLTLGDELAPEDYMDKDAINAWASSAHATGGVNCAGCHAPELEEPQNIALMQEQWIEKPGLAVCADCHKPQAKTFTQGKHGMRFHPKVSKPRKAPKDGIGAIAAHIFKDEPLTAMTVGESTLALKPEAAHLELGNCNACHKPHEVDLEVAAVESCASCHNDTHTQNYFTSPHFALWEAEIAGEGEPGTGVSCADCHMPKLKDRRAGFVTNHNQNDYLRPNEKMIRPVCMSCHSVEFAIDALADTKLVENNFNGSPTAHIESIDWAVKQSERKEK